MMPSIPVYIPQEEPIGSGSVPPREGIMPAKRTRVLLSCGPCRQSKLKCDRESPCGQCVRKGRVSVCEYSPKPTKKTRSKGMSARLQRLEGMVRGMVGNGTLPLQTVEGNINKATVTPDNSNGPDNMAQIVQGETTTFVGATHFMAILDDIEDLKSYFDDTDETSSTGLDSTHTSPSNVDHLLLGLTGPKSKEDLLAMVPEKTVMDRLLMKYFNSHSPSQRKTFPRPHGPVRPKETPRPSSLTIYWAQDVIHRPTFAKQYAVFCKDPSSVHMHWLALLFMMIGLGIFFSIFSSPHEIESESSIPPFERFKMYRAAAGWALLDGKYTQPGPMTLQPFMLYVEAEFMVSRAGQMDCYLLTSTLIRLMLKMGLHRDPDRLVNISPFDGEMRRRLWNMALQVDALVSFHMGLPSMVAGIQYDTQLPKNLLDEDFGEDSVELPPERQMTDYTPMSYAICKSDLAATFSRIANIAHALSPPAYVEVMRMDVTLEEKWKGLPSFLQMKPIEECIADAPIQTIQRFGIASMYNKSKCVLHRRFMIGSDPLPEHSYSRKACLEGALDILEYQQILYDACLPGRILSQNCWFVNSLAMHDFLLAAMIVFIAIQGDTYGSPGYMPAGYTPPTKVRLHEVLERSHAVWAAISQHFPEAKKTAGVLRTMLRKIDAESSVGARPLSELEIANSSGIQSTFDSRPISISNLTITTTDSLIGAPIPVIPDPFTVSAQSHPNTGLMTSTGLTMAPSDPIWMTLDPDLDWRFFDNVISGSTVGADQMGVGERLQDWSNLSPSSGDLGQLFGSVPSWQPQ